MSIKASLQLALADTLTTSELRDLANLAAERGITIERLLFESAKAEADRIRRDRETTPAA